MSGWVRANKIEFPTTRWERYNTWRINSPHRVTGQGRGRCFWRSFISTVHRDENLLFTFQPVKIICRMLYSKVLTLSMCVTSFCTTVFPNMPERMHGYTGCICLAFLHCASSNVSLKCLPLIWFFSTVCFQMLFQMVCPRWCKVTLAALVWFFAIMHYQVSLQIACMRSGKSALVTSFGSFHFQMCP